MPAKLRSTTNCARATVSQKHRKALAALLKNTTAHFIWIRQRTLFVALAAGVVLITGAGCQTFRMSEEDFQKQQRGETVDKETGDAVAVVGTLGYYGYMLGECLSAAFGK